MTQLNPELAEEDRQHLSPHAVCSGNSNVRNNMFPSQKCHGERQDGPVDLKLFH